MLEEGLTVSGKPIKDHQEVMGHARAIELIYDALSADLDKQFIFDLHLALQTEKIHDSLKPNGAWKLESKGTYEITKKSEQVFIEYALPQDVECLMQELVVFINDFNSVTKKNAHRVYTRKSIWVWLMCILFGMVMDGCRVCWQTCLCLKRDYLR